MSSEDELKLGLIGIKPLGEIPANSPHFTGDMSGSLSLSVSSVE
jgi:hypothetical protein